LVVSACDFFFLLVVVELPDDELRFP